jgi:hypothetical protein
MNLLDELTPSDRDRANADRAFKELEREIHLLTEQNLLPELAEPGLILAGSNFRETALAPITHLNVLFVINPNSVKVNEQDGMVSFIGPDPFLDGLKNPSGLLQPVLLMKALLSALAGFSAKQSFFGQSIHIKLKKSPIEIKLTPAIPFLEGYLIPEEKSELLWKRINPTKEKEVIFNLNKRHSGNVIAAIRCMKYWNQTRNTGSFRGYHLEAIACLIFEEIPTPITSLMNAMELYIKQMSKYIYNCPDPVRLSETIHRYLPDSIDQWYLFMNRIGELKAAIEKGEKETAEFLQAEIAIAE